MGFLSVMREDAGADRDDGVNRWFLFRRTISVRHTPSYAPLRITCDGRYQLFVNGIRVGRGPVRSTAMALKTDSYDIAQLLVPGHNCLAVLIHCYGVDTAHYERVRGMWHPSFGDGGLWLDGEFECGPDSIDISSGPEWRVIQSDAWDSTTGRMNSGLGFVESHDSRRLPADWTSPEFDDSGWDKATIQYIDGGGPDAFFGGLDVEPFPTLAPNPLPPLIETNIAADHLVAAYRVSSRPDLPVHEQLYAEPIIGPAPGIDSDSVMPFTVQPSAAEGVSLLFRFDTLLTGYPYIEFIAPAGTIIDIAVRETIAGEYGEGIGRTPRIPREPILGHDAHVARVVARGGQQRFERFEWSAARWLQITVRGSDTTAAEPVTLLTAGVVDTHYPAKFEGDFGCSDPLLEQLWALGRTTLTRCMHDAWEDCPSREQRQWLGDVTVEHAAAQAAFGPSANALTAKYLLDVADSQRPDGLTQMFAPGDHKVNALLIPDWTLQWVLTAGDYLGWTGDLETIEAIFPAIQKALAWFEKLRISNGLIADLPYWHFMDWAAVGRKGEAVTLNAQLAGACKAAAIMADALEYGRAAGRYRTVAAEISKALNLRHWDAVRGIYVDCVDAATGAQNRRVSQHGNAAMILWGDAPPERWATMIERITDTERLTFTAAPPIAPVGDVLDEEEGVVLANTFYSHFVYAALGKARRTDKALALMRAHYGPMITAGAVTLWESYGPTASLCHGFSASPTFHLTTQVLGLKPKGIGATQFLFDPDLGDMDAANGKLATVNGVITVTLQRQGNNLAAVLTLPSDIEAFIGPRWTQAGERLLGGQTYELTFEPVSP
jgi:alpha-L-rhamnosidase